MTLDIKNALAIITGAASGIGRGIALKCASLESNVALIDIDSVGLNRVKSHLSHLYPLIKIETFTCDVSDYDALKEVVKDIQSIFSTSCIRMLFNNVGISCMGDILYSKYGNDDVTELNRLRKTMDCNLWSMIYLTRLCLPLLLNNPSSKQCYIVNTGSIGSILYANGFYYITKHAVLALSQTISMEIKQIKNKNQILVTTLCPGYVRNTNFYKSSKNIHNIDDKEYNKIIKDIEQIDNKIIEKISLNVDNVINALFEGLKLKKSVITTHNDLLHAGILDNIKYIKDGNKYSPKNISKVIKQRMKQSISKL